MSEADSMSDECQNWSDADSMTENTSESDASSVFSEQNQQCRTQEYYDNLFSSNQKLHPNLNCNVAECMVLLLIICMRHNLYWECLLDLIEMINTIVGASIIPKSKHMFKKYFPFHIKPEYHYYCTVCNNSLESKEEKICSICNKQTFVDISKGHNFFVTLPIAEQIRLNLKKNLSYIKKIGTSNNKITDILSTNRYQELSRGIKNLITITLNTDGIKIFKSSKKGEFWPIQFSINELDENIRFNRENIIVCGFWFGKHPNIEQFLKPLLLELKALNNKIISFASEGIRYEFNIQVIQTFYNHYIFYLNIN